jgi:CDP-paratose 2-epimerase
MKVLITGSSGLVGSEMVKFLNHPEYEVFGIDNDSRAYFFGKEASTEPTKLQLMEECKNFHPIGIDLRNLDDLRAVFQNYGPFDLIVHAAAQPAHDWSIDNTIEDFQMNAVVTVNMLECFRQYSRSAVFIQVSTSKVYGDHVNELPLVELETRYELPEFEYKSGVVVGNVYGTTWEGVNENMSIQGCIHSPFGASKACGDLMAQEFARYYGLKIAIFRPVCITGPAHKGAKLHGYLAYLVKCIATGHPYVINGYKGKQVRGNIHAHDLVSAFYEVFMADCPFPGEFYNIDGGRESNNSILEAIAQAERILGVKGAISYSEENRRGDHRWCIFDNTKFKSHYPSWKLTYDNDRIMEELCAAHKI